MLDAGPPLHREGYFDYVIWDETTTQEGLSYAPQEQSYTIISPSGERVQLKKVGTSDISNIYESVNSTNLRLYVLTNSSKSYLITPNGTSMKFVRIGNTYRCIQVQDRNGNYLFASYDSEGRLLSMTDSLARVITFNYEGANLVSMTQSWGAQTHTWAKFEYEPLTIQSNFVKADGAPLNSIGAGRNIQALKRVIFADQSSYRFSYNAWGQVYKIARHAADDHLLSYSSYNLPANTSAPLTDCPRFTEKRVWAQYSNGDVDSVPVPGEEALSKYTIALEGEAGSVTLPDGLTTHKEYFGTTSWQRGLTTKVETYYGTTVDSSTLKKWTTTTWTQDDESLNYRQNPRPVETNIYDSQGNRRRSRIEYYPTTSFSLPKETFEYDSDGTTVLRRTLTTYNLSSEYVSRRIIGLVSERFTYGRVDGQEKLASKVSYEYDLDGAHLVSQDAVNHDGNYGTWYPYRGNVCVTRIWNTENPTDINQSIKSLTGYNTSGSVIFMRSAVGSAEHQTNISYADSNGGNTFAYPTKVTDAEGFSSSIAYTYYTGQVLTSTDPKGLIILNQYDAFGRLEKKSQRTTATGPDITFISYTYKPSMTEVETSKLLDRVNNADQLSYTSQRLDGLGRVIGIAGNHPGSVGNFSGQKFKYDVLGRVVGQTNPSEISDPANKSVSEWTLAGDDVDGGWAARTTKQTYDWNGRPLISTNTDLTTNEISYEGCGCAGGEVVTIKGEQLTDSRRTQKIYSDILGREYKTEILDWAGNVYTSTVNSYDQRDQITLVRQYAGAASSTNTNYQDTVYTYDGYGRLQSRHVPEQDSGKATTYGYYADGKIKSMTDARGATTNYEYFERGLLKKISYSVPAGSNIAVPGATTFSYDEAGNRIGMTDQLGSVVYEYNNLSQLESETRSFNEAVPQAPADNKFKIQYAYTLSGQLKNITDPFGESVAYGHDSAGRLTSMTGTLPNGIGTVQYTNDAHYSAWGALKHIVYGNGLEMQMTFNNRQQAKEYKLKGRRDYSPSYTDDLTVKYEYNADGRLRSSEESHSRSIAYPSAQFARSYEYDFMGRLTLAKTGAEARGQTEPDYNKRPYRQAYNYDAFGHMTEITRWHWTEFYHTFPIATFKNNRNINQSEAIQYDADGRKIGINAYAAQYPSAWMDRYKYDAGGRLVFYSDYYGQPLSGNTLSLDGLGQTLKSFSTDRDCDPEGRCELTTYFIRSSILGGEPINEISVKTTPGIPNMVPPTREDTRQTYIFAGDSRIARHKIVQHSLSSHRDHDTTYLENRDASGAVFDEMILRSSVTPYTFGSAPTMSNYLLEADPFGTIVGPWNPYLPQDEGYGGPRCAGPEYGDCGEEDEEDPDYSDLDYEDEGYGNPVSLTCYVEGFAHPCKDAFEFLNNLGDDAVTVTKDKEFNIPSDSAPQAVWKPEYSTKSLGDVINDIDPNGKPEQLIAQVNIGIVDEGSFVISNIDWDPQTQTRTRSRRGQSRQPTDRAPREPEPRKEPCNITLGMIEGLSADSGNLFWVVFHEITPIGYYGTNGLDESGRRNGPKLEGDVLETEARYLASAIINYGGRENVSQTVWDPSYINRGGGTTPQDIYNEAWNGRAGRPEEGINAHLNSTAGSNACLKLNIVYRAVTTGGVGLGGEYKWWRASSTRRFNKDRGDIRQGSTDFLTYNPATEQQQGRRRR